MPDWYYTFWYGFNWFALLYFAGLSFFYGALLAISILAVRAYNREFTLMRGTGISPVLTKPFSLLVPAYNEEEMIVDSVRSFLQLDFREFEVIVANDGSTDRTLARLVEAFDLVPVDYDISGRYPCTPVRTVYFSRSEPRLVVVDKENSGKADTLNAAANCARYPYVGAVDADSVLSVDSMRKLMQRFSAAPTTVGVGGVVRISNGCRVENGAITSVAMPRRVLPQIQVVEYLRAFMFGRMGWSYMNILLIISGAFGVFRQDLLTRVRGWNPRSLGEDMDLVAKLHRYIQRNKSKNRLSFAPDPVCWTQVPADLHSLSSQRNRWQRGLMQTLFANIGMMLNPRYGRIGLVGMPYFFFFEMLSGVMEFISYPLIIISFWLGIINLPFFILFLVVAIIWGLCLTYAGIYLEEVSYHRYPGWRDLGRMLLAGFIENFGYRQLHAWWRFKGFVQFILNPRMGWGKIKRTGYAKS